MTGESTNPNKLICMIDCLKAKNVWIIVIPIIDFGFRNISLLKLFFLRCYFGLDYTVQVSVAVAVPASSTLPIASLSLSKDLWLQLSYHGRRRHVLLVLITAN